MCNIVMAAKWSTNKRRYNRHDGVVWMKILLIVCFHVAIATAKFQQDVYKATQNMQGTVITTVQVATVIECGRR